MEIESSFVCAYCFQINATIVDASAGTMQKYIEDCQVCCRPNLLTVAVEEGDVSATIEAEPC